jgi:hypothetical protein
MRQTAVAIPCPDGLLAIYIAYPSNDQENCRRSVAATRRGRGTGKLKLKVTATTSGGIKRTATRAVKVR